MKKDERSSHNISFRVYMIHRLDHWLLIFAIFMDRMRLPGMFWKVGGRVGRPYCTITTVSAYLFIILPKHSKGPHPDPGISAAEAARQLARWQYKLQFQNLLAARVRKMLKESRSASYW